MELQVGVNSYMNLDEVKQFIDDYILTDAITEYVESLSDNYISKIINSATKLIEKLDFKGVRVDSEQKLKFPRYIYNDFKKTLISCPDDVKAGIVLQAIYDSYYTNKYQDKLDMRKIGISSKSLGSASISFNSNITDEKLKNGIYRDVFETYLRKYTIYI